MAIHSHLKKSSNSSLDILLEKCRFEQKKSNMHRRIYVKLQNPIY